VSAYCGNGLPRGGGRVLGPRFPAVGSAAGNAAIAKARKGRERKTTPALSGAIAKARKGRERKTTATLCFGRSASRDLAGPVRPVVRAG